MTKWTCLAVLMFAACADDPPPASDTEACEHLAMGPFTMVTATTAKDAQTPAVGSDHMAYTITLPGTGIGYVRFDAAAAADHVLYLDRDVMLAVQNAQSMPVAATSTAKSSDACATIKSRVQVPLTVGGFFIALGPDAGGPVNLVVEAAE